MSLLLLLGGAGASPPPSGIPTLTIEVAFGYTWQDPDPTWTDVTSYVEGGVSINRGRSRELDTFQTGTANFTLKNDDRRFDPWYTAGPYYGQLLPNVPVRIRGTWTSTVTLFRGFVDGWPQTYTTYDSIAQVQVNCSDAFKLLTQFSLTTGVFTFDDPDLGFDNGRFGGGGFEEEQLSGARVNAILDLCGWPDELRDIAEGVTVCQDQETSGSALDALQIVERSEDGFLYVEADGSITFVDRYGREDLTRMNTSQGSFSDATDDSPYVDIVYPYDDQLIYNDIRRQREGGVEQSAEDSTSIGLYFRKVHSDTGLVMNSDEVARGLAIIFLERYREPQQRIDGLVINPDGSPLIQWPLVFGLQILDRITVSRTPVQTGDPISGDYWVQGMRHTYSGLKWLTTYYVTPVDEFEFFTFDDITRGFDSAAVFAP